MLPSSNDLYIFVFDSVSIATRGAASQEDHLSSGGQFFCSTLLYLMNCQQHMIAKKSFYSLWMLFALTFLCHYLI